MKNYCRKEISKMADLATFIKYHVPEVAKEMEQIDKIILKVARKLEKMENEAIEKEIQKERLERGEYTTQELKKFIIDKFPGLKFTMSIQKKKKYILVKIKDVKNHSLEKIKNHIKEVIAQSCYKNFGLFVL